MSRSSNPEAVVREIRRKTRRRYSAEEKIRIVLEGLKGEESISGGRQTPFDRSTGPAILGVAMTRRNRLRVIRL
jgi:hypothetical protein